MPIDELIEQRVLRPLGMTSTMLPRGDDSPRGRLTPEYKGHAVQGYADNGEPIGQPGEQTSYYHWPGTGQMYSSPRDMMAFLAANLDELPVDQSLRDVIALAHRNVLRIGPGAAFGNAHAVPVRPFFLVLATSANQTGFRPAFLFSSGCPCANVEGTPGRLT